MNFNPLSPHGERQKRWEWVVIGADFNPLSPHGERPDPRGGGGRADVISIHSPRMGRDYIVLLHEERSRISIHSPRMGRDLHPGGSAGRSRISIHSPRMGRDISEVPLRRGTFNFNPLSPHGERLAFRPFCPGESYFNPLSPHGERPVGGVGGSGSGISIHSPRMGRDFSTYLTDTFKSDFNPLSPHGERRSGRRDPAESLQISIHSPRMGRDLIAIIVSKEHAISIHSPRMGRDESTFGKSSG